MNNRMESQPEHDRTRLLYVLERLMVLPNVELKATLSEASQLLAEAMQADKIDVFILDPASSTLVALGVSDTPMGAHQREIGLDRLPLANGGREVEVYYTGEPYLSAHADLDTGVLPGFRYELNIHSMVIVPLEVGGERQGVIQVASARSEVFTRQDVSFVAALAHWIGMIAHRAQLIERITEAAVEQARRKAADELVTVLAHDLNNYLTPIQGRVNLLRRRAIKDDRPQDLADIAALLHVVERLSNLVNDLLDVERLEQSLFVINTQALDLVPLLEETVGVLATADTPVELHIQTRDEPIVLADLGRLRQALENVLSNAIKHSPKGVAVTTRLEIEQREEGRWAVVTIHDSGDGVPAEVVPRLFSRFAAGPGSSGLGLGLYMARSIAEAHGGKLTYDPPAHGGASFRLELPLAVTWLPGEAGAVEIVEAVERPHH